MNLSDLNELDFQNIGGWPPAIKGVAVFLLIVAILVGGYFWKAKDQLATLERTERKELELKRTFEKKQAKASRLASYKAQLDEMKLILQSMLRQLPSRTEMPDLLVDVSQTAISTGIDTQLFRPGAESVKDFYAEKPISIRMIGSYHQFGAFVSGVASLPRVVILTMHDISLQPVGGDKSSGELMLEGTAKTYRYLEEDEDEFASLEEES